MVLLCLILFSCKETTENPDGKVTASSCKSHFIIFPGSDIDAVEYSWNNSILHIKHINAGFNCCPDGFGFSLNKKTDTLIITEFEHAALCNCNCLYDLEYDLVNITGQAYFIRIIEPYLPSGDTVLEFTADLSTKPSGNFSVKRSGYPWGL